MRSEIEKLKKREITIIETRKKLRRRKNRKADWISLKSVRRCAGCLWRVRFEKVGEEE